jgi:nucleoside 2-deoxyribosyltransferase
MKIYVAAPLGHAVLATFVADELVRLGHDVTSRWHRRVAVALEDGPVQDPVSPNERLSVLDANLRDLNGAATVVALTHVGEPRATFSEIGYAVARGKRVVWVQSWDGRGRNILDEHGLVDRLVIGGGGPNLVALLESALKRAA